MPGQVSAGGVCPGVFLKEGCLPRGCLPSAGGCTPPSCGQTDICENITFPQLLLRTVIIQELLCNSVHAIDVSHVITAFSFGIESRFGIG